MTGALHPQKSRRRLLSLVLSLSVALSPLAASLALGGLPGAASGKIPVCTAQGIVWFDPAAPEGAPPGPGDGAGASWCPLCPVTAAAAPPPAPGAVLRGLPRAEPAAAPDGRVETLRFSAAPRAIRAPPAHA